MGDRNGNKWFLTAQFLLKIHLCVKGEIATYSHYPHLCSHYLQIVNSTGPEDDEGLLYTSVWAQEDAYALLSRTPRNVGTRQMDLEMQTNLLREQRLATRLHPAVTLGFLATSYIEICELLEERMPSVPL